MYKDKRLSSVYWQYFLRAHNAVASLWIDAKLDRNKALSFWEHRILKNF